MHQPLDPGTTNSAAAAAQHGVDPRRAIGAAAFAMDPPDVLEQHPIGGGTRAFGPRAPGIVAADRQTQRRAHHSDWPEVAMLIDEPELYREAAPKMSAAFFRISRSIRSRSFSRRKRAFSAARSDGDTTGACVIGRRRSGRLASQPHYPSSQHRLVQP